MEHLSPLANQQPHEKGSTDEGREDSHWELCGHGHCSRGEIREHQENRTTNR
jgi:hypothetical protein